MSANHNDIDAPTQSLSTSHSVDRPTDTLLLCRPLSTLSLNTQRNPKWKAGEPTDRRKKTKQRTAKQKTVIKSRRNDGELGRGTAQHHLSTSADLPSPAP